MSSMPLSSEIELDQAVAGMTLAAALCDANGSVLLPQDATLTDATLASLRRRGIARCVVWRSAAAPDPALRAREQERQLQRLHHLFRHCAGQDATPLLLRLLIDYRKQDRA